jgi:hypothetical protein
MRVPAGDPVRQERATKPMPSATSPAAVWTAMRVESPHPGVTSMPVA